MTGRVVDVGQQLEVVAGLDHPNRFGHCQRRLGRAARGTLYDPFVMMALMTNTTTSVRRPAVVASPPAEQLTLLPSLAPNRGVTARFRLSKDTRERGLRHVAEIRQILAERSGAPGSISMMHQDRAA